MSVTRRLLAPGVVGATVLLTAALATGTASAHGSLYGPVSRVASCYAEGPEHPQSQVCKDLVAMSGTQPLYDWNEVNIANANGQSQQIIPDGKLCSANRDKYKALDMARTDWPATGVQAGSFTFNFRVTAPHQGGMTLYITKQGYDPTKPLKWSDLDLANPVVQYPTARTATNGYYTFSGTLPARTGRQLLYLVWQRTDSPEAFYGCSDVVYGQGAAAAGALAPAAPQAPSEQQIAAGYSRSTVDHRGHGGDHQAAAAQGAGAAPLSGGSVGSLVLGGSALLSVAASAVYVYRRRPGAVGQAA
ncbi:lytic polysaccharide monooxygenase [Kitasatospora sp. NPDC048540]|uniref:lytic polysaccharide monooxygenase auxiliary activity family 9 protein n=1 Tax=unclassified Kitasatospora TaxID=2633591 RepID=UPI00053BADB7|nr:lytic polysaccharide monooxygenase [Kitasatospora sp. MBT63]